jgi:hypothetical protein
MQFRYLLFCDTSVSARPISDDPVSFAAPYAVRCQLGRAAEIFSKDESANSRDSRKTEGLSGVYPEKKKGLNGMLYCSSRGETL